MITANVFYEQLKSQKDQLEKRMRAIKDDKTKANGPLNPDFEEQAIDLQNNEVIDEIEEIDRKEIGLINKALEKIKNNRFGICEACGEEINQKRLIAMPFAENCIKCTN